MTTSARRGRPINTMIGVRVGKLDKRQLQMAAEANHQTLSSFLRDAAIKEAYRVLSKMPEYKPMQNLGGVPLKPGESRGPN